eukprot:scaffold28302_cov59-Phaeocystis_antarctica.AAC.2
MPKGLDRQRRADRGGELADAGDHHRVGAGSGAGSGGGSGAGLGDHSWTPLTPTRVSRGLSSVPSSAAPRRAARRPGHLVRTGSAACVRSRVLVARARVLDECRADEQVD